MIRIDELAGFLKENPDYTEILVLALEQEAAHDEDENYLGWRWDDVRAANHQIKKLIIEGITKISYRSRSDTRYRLVDMQAAMLAVNLTPDDIDVEEEVEIPDDLFDVVVGYEPIKDLLLKGLRSSSSVHFLLWGPPGTAKSLILDCIRRLPHTVLVLGSSLTKAGLRDVIMDRPGRDIILCLDEIEKVDNPRDLDVLLRVMETGGMVKTVHASHREVSKRIRVVATANQIHRLSPEIKSRFVTFQFNQYTDEEFLEVGTRVLTMLEYASEEIARYIPLQVLDQLGSRDVRDCIKVYRLVSESEEEVEATIKTLKKYGTPTSILAKNF